MFECLVSGRWNCLGKVYFQSEFFRIAELIEWISLSSPLRKGTYQNNLQAVLQPIQQWLLINGRSKNLGSSV